MFLAAGREEPYIQFQMTHSPLRLDAYFLDILMKARASEHGTKGFTAGGGAMPVPGVSAPIYWRSAVAQGLAEALGGWITAKLIDPSIRPYCSTIIWAPDMNTGKWAFHAPEGTLFYLLCRQVQRELLGITLYAGCGQIDRMCLEAAQGARIFKDAGGREGCFSPAHLAIDLEKMRFAESFAAGVPFPDGKGDTARIVKEVLPEGAFLTHESSLRYRELYWHPTLFTGMTHEETGRALATDSDALLPQSREIARQRLAEHEFALSDDVRREVEKIYRAGCRAMLAADTQ